MTLFYIYWEPSGAERFAELVEHRDEIKSFSERVAGSHPRLRAISYPELWRFWSQASPEWLASHLHYLRARYAVAL